MSTWSSKTPAETDNFLTALREEEWTEVVLNYENNPQDFYSAYWYVNSHPIFDEYMLIDGKPNYAQRYLIENQGIFKCDITPAKINPATDSISEDRSLNTKVVFWYEIGPFYQARDIPEEDRENCPPAGTDSHNVELDGQADSFEAAVIAIAAKIKQYYGHDRSRVIW